MTDGDRPQEPRPFRLLSLAELFALRLPELRWAVEGILPLGSFTMLAAREKAGKGLLVIDLCCSVALGEPFLDRAVEPGPALYVAAEENVREVRARLGNRLGHRRDCPMYVLPVNGFVDEALGVGDTLRIDDPALLGRLYATIRELRPSVVVLDPLRELHNQRENESDDMSALLRPLRQIAHATDTALVVNHHMSTTGRARRSTSIRAAVDQEWALHAKEAKEDGTDATAGGVLRIQGRFGGTQTIGVLLGEGQRWAVTDFGPGPDPSVKARLLQLLALGGWLDAEAIADQVGATRRGVQGALRELLAEAPPQIETEGQGVRGDPRRYRLTADARFGQPALGADGPDPNDRSIPELGNGP